MKEEIKDILELLRDGVKRPVVTLSKYSLDNICELNPNECKKLLEYIENLQSQLKAKEEVEKEFIKYLEAEKDRLAREVSQIYEDSLGKTKLVNEDIFNEVNNVLSKYNEILSKGENK